MAIKDIEKRKIESSAKEETAGVTKDGFYDPNGEYPRRDYKNSSSINRSARGLDTNEINVSGGDPNAPIETSTVTKSVFPNNQTQETASGHIIEIDDTIGNERVMIKHRLGSGVELRPDGSVIVSSVKNTIQISGADQTVIVEGNGKLVYKGNLDLNVTGDFNLNVGGDFNVTAGGDKNETIKHSSTTTIVQDELIQVKGSSTKNIEDNETKTVRKSSTHKIKETFTLSADEVDHSYHKGVIGGDEVDFAGETMSANTFYGSLEGNAKTSTQAGSAGTAGSIGAGGSAGIHTATSVTYTPLTDSDLDSDINISTIDLYTDTNNVPYVNFTPTLSEIRSMLRTSATRGDTLLTNQLIKDNIINSSFNDTAVPNTNRIQGKAVESRRGDNAIGTNPPTFNNKSFKW